MQAGPASRLRIMSDEAKPRLGGYATHHRPATAIRLSKAANTRRTGVHCRISLKPYPELARELGFTTYKHALTESFRTNNSFRFGSESSTKEVVREAAGLDCCFGIV